MNRYNSHLSSFLFTMDFFSYNFCLLFLPRLNNERLLGLLATGASKSIVVDSTQLVIFDSLDSFLVAQLPEFATEGSGRQTGVEVCEVMESGILDISRMSA